MATTIELQERRLESTNISTRTGESIHDSQDNLTHVVSAQAIDATIPDGGYGWVVVFACAIVSFWFTGVSYSWGVLQKELVQQNVASPSTLSFVGGLTAACIAVFAIASARLIAVIGSRWTGMLGVIFVGGGQLLASFKPDNIASLFICVGVITGIGCR
jgi:hypothetical protein